MYISMLAIYKSLYIRELLYQYLIPVFRLQYNLYEFTIRMHKFNRLFCTEKLVLIAGLKDF